MQAALFSNSVSEAQAAWVQVQPSPQKPVFSQDPAGSGGGRSVAGRWAERCGAAGGACDCAPSMLRRVVAGGAARAGPRPAEAAAAAARDSMRGPLGKSWQLCVRLTPLASHWPHLSLPREPPTSLARTLLGPCLGVKGRPRRGWQPGPKSRGLRSPFRCPARGGGRAGVGSRGRGSLVGPFLVPCRDLADPPSQD